MLSLLLFLVRLFPEAFRERFGDELRHQVREDFLRARSRGPGAGAWFVATESLNLIRSATAEWWAPTWTGPVDLPAEAETMWGSLSEWAMDFRHAARALRRTPGFTGLAVGTLALAIGANAGLFGVVNTVLFNPLHFPEPDRLVYIAASAPGTDMPEEFGVSDEFFLQYREQSKQLSGVATFNSFTSTLRTPDRVERIRMSAPSWTMFQTLGASPILGRSFTAEDESRVTVISYALWSSWFGRDPSVIGKQFYVAGRDRTVIGVMGRDFRFPDNGTLLWFPNPIGLDSVQPGRFGEDMVGRLAPGATIESLTRELNTLASRLPERFGGSPGYARIMAKHRAVVRPMSEQMLGPVARPIWVLLGAVAIVLLIACANVANLFLVRAEGRQRDLAVRRALGARRGQLIRLQMAESLIVAGLAGVLAIVLAGITFPVFLRAAPAGIPRIDEVRLDLPTLGFTLVAALATALICGAVPALRGSSPDLRRLRDGGRGATRRRHFARNALVIGQTALALVLLIGSGLLVRSFWALRNVRPGYDTRDLFTFQIAPDRPTLNSVAAFAEFDLAFMDRLRALPGVTSVGLVENIPLDEGTASQRIRAEGKEYGSEGGTLLNFTYTAGDYFSSMGIQVLKGRTFGLDDHRTALGNVILSRSAANLLWPGEDPIGRRIQRERSTTWETVVGVVDDVMQDGFRDTPQALVYFPLVAPFNDRRAVSSPAYVVKTARAEVIAPEVRQLVKEVAPEAPMYRVYTMAELARRSMMQLSFTMLTLGIISALALILGAVGLYGVLSYIVAERTREIGVRMALGARAEQVRGMVVAQGAQVVGAGVAIGVVVALATTRALGSLLFGVKALDLRTFLAMSLSMVAVGLLASYLPARRASTVDPIESLRGD